MEEGTQNKYLRRSLAILFTGLFIAIVCMTLLTFFNPNSLTNQKEIDIDYPINKVWTALVDKKYYLESKKEIMKSNIYDSISPKWTEYYTPSDSVENKTVRFVPNRYWAYLIINRKYEQVNAISITLDSITPSRTNILVKERSRFLNNWASIYFQLFHPNTVVDYEIVKINNTLTYIDSLSSK